MRPTDIAMSAAVFWTFATAFYVTFWLGDTLLGIVLVAAGMAAVFAWGQVDD